MKLRKIMAVGLAFALGITAIGCGNKDKEQESKDAELTKELEQNDYRGGVMRAITLKDSILQTVTDMKSNNDVIREDNPNSYWTSSDYQDFVTTMFDIPIILDTQWFNEEETDWNTIINQMKKSESTFTENSDTSSSSDEHKLNNGITITRNEKDDYSIANVKDKMATKIITPTNTTNASTTATTSTDSITTNYRILYDCGKDWCQAYNTVSLLSNIKPFTSQLFEYRRLSDDEFVIQTSTEKLYIALEPTDTDTDLRNRKISEFYYSKLVSDGERSSFKHYQKSDEKDNGGTIDTKNITTNQNMAMYPLLNEKGDYALRYGLNDSIFSFDADDLDKNWVVKDKALQQIMSYKEGALSVLTYNKLTHKYEQFVYSTEEADSSTIDELEDLINKNELIGDGTQDKEQGSENEENEGTK